MKKIFSFVLCAATAMMVSAQLTISPTGMMDEIGFQAENMSPDASSFACGLNQLSQQPAIWDVVNEEVQEFAYRDTIYDYQPIYGTKPGWEYIYDYSISWWEPVDSIWGEVEDYDNIIGYDTIFDIDDYTGTFHAINNNGLAVGSFGSGYGSKFPVKAAYGDTAVTYLYFDRETEFGGDAYAVNADGSVIVGFYFDESWVTTACVWKNGGLTAADRINLPAPTDAQFGSGVDYVSARWMSADASVILGYAQDAVNGKWVMVYWTLEADGNYAVHAEYANQYFTPYEYDFEGVASWVKPSCPYAEFEPQAISANGEWVTLVMTPQYDPNDWFALQVKQAGRLNLTTSVLEVLDLGEYDAPIFYGIADNGTAVGATEAGGFGPMSTLGESLSAERVGYVWPAGDTAIYSLQEIFPNEDYFAYGEGNGEAAIASITADGSKIIGYTNQTDGVDTWVTSSFIATLPTVETGVQRVESEKAPSMKFIENGQVIILHNGARFNMMGQKIR